MAFWLSLFFFHAAKGEHASPLEMRPGLQRQYAKTQEARLAVCQPAKALLLHSPAKALSPQTPLQAHLPCLRHQGGPQR